MSGFRRLLGFIFSLLAGLSFAQQQDSLSLQISLLESGHRAQIKQTIIHYHQGEQATNRVVLLNWNAAYQPQNTPLAKRLLEARKTSLYFSKPNQRGRLMNLKINEQALTALDQEWIEVPLEKPLNQGERVVLHLDYEIQLPEARFTGYGIQPDEISLKYFFLVPTDAPRHFLNIEENQSSKAYWRVQFSENQRAVFSNLPEVSPQLFEGSLSDDPYFILKPQVAATPYFRLKYKNTLVEIPFPLTYEQQQNLNFYLPLQLNFIEGILGDLPKKILISKKIAQDYGFMGIDDIKFWKFKFQLFNNAEKTDLEYFSILSQLCVAQQLNTDKIQQHWIENGIKTYIEIQYLKRFYKDKVLLGDLPQQLSLWGIQPLKWTYLSKMKLTERYGLASQYMMSQNLDQPIATPFPQLSNFNQVVISQMQMGSLLNFVAEKMGEAEMNQWIQKFTKEHSGKPISTEDFLNQLAMASQYSSAFLSDFITKKNRVNFKLKNFKIEGENMLVKVKKNTEAPIPFQLKAIKNDDQAQIYWYDTYTKKETDYRIPKDSIKKIILNDNDLFPELNNRDNYLYTKGLFSNLKKPKLKFYKDIPNPEYHEIFLTPIFRYNYYDKLLLGLGFSNASLIEQPFTYALKPYFSTGTGQLMGTAGASYTFAPADSFFQNWRVGGKGTYFHYDKDLAFRKLSLYTSLDFNKNPRSQIGRQLGLSYDYVSKDLSPEMEAANDYSKYYLFNIGYLYTDRKAIHENTILTNLQHSEDFNKLSAELFYRWEYQQNKKLSLRFFGGYFLRNQTRNAYFDFGISSLSNYSFSYSIIRRNHNDYYAPRQFVLGEGAFKSAINATANQWLTTVNADVQIWKMLNLYADAGIYKNRDEQSQFIWDSGVSVKLIPDIFEIYFPMQSSLGFEPALPSYQKRIRFMFNFNLSAIVAQLRRGWF